jgi:hypothetical protein
MKLAPFNRLQDELDWMEVGSIVHTIAQEEFWKKKTTICLKLKKVLACSAVEVFSYNLMLSLSTIFAHEKSICND